MIFLDRVRNYSKTVVTHTALGTSQRFVTLQIIKEIVARDGVVGFTPLNAFFPSFEKYIDTYRDMAEKTSSVENLAVASDFGGADAKYLFAELDEIGKLGRVAEELSQRGQFSDEEVAKIMYGNVARIVGRL